MARVEKKRKPEAAPKTPMELLMYEHLESLRTRGYSEFTVKNRRVHIGFFIGWAYEHGLREPIEVTRPVLERYQRYLFFYRKKNGEPLTFRSQHARLVPLRVWFKWMTRQNHTLLLGAWFNAVLYILGLILLLPGSILAVLIPLRSIGSSRLLPFTGIDGPGYENVLYVPVAIAFNCGLLFLVNRLFVRWLRTRPLGTR